MSCWHCVVVGEELPSPFWPYWPKAGGCLLEGVVFTQRPPAAPLPASEAAGDFPGDCQSQVSGRDHVLGAQAHGDRGGAKAGTGQAELQLEEA